MSEHGIRLLSEHAIACWISEGPAMCRAGSYVAGDKGRALYYRTRAVVVYDRSRDSQMKPLESIEAEYATPVNFQGGTR